MSKSLYDAEGWVGPAASVHGWHLLVLLLENEPGPIGELIEKGLTDDPEGTAKALDDYLQAHPDLDDDNRSTSENLVTLLRKCDLVGIVSDTLSE
jgi:hypothetical protein